MKKARIILAAAGILAAGGLVFYRPVRENVVYRKESSLPDVSGVQEDSGSNEKLIKWAKETLEDAFSTDIYVEDYLVRVEYESSQAVPDQGQGTENTDTAQESGVSSASVNFCDRDTGKSIYTAVCDTVTGEILTLMQQTDAPEKSSYMKTSELEAAAKAFLEKLTGETEEDISGFEGSLGSDIYTAEITLKDSEEKITLRLDAFYGSVLYYSKTD